jgi:hypothetical protein
MRKLSWAVSAMSILGVAPVYADSPSEIGTAAITKNAVTIRMAAQQRPLKIGDHVFQNETVVTGNEAGAQILFRDETALTMGPDSSVVLDTMVYDPEKRSGKMTIRALSGAFRFVSGSGPKDGYQIETPMGTIGVRGTIVRFWLGSDELKVQVDEGAATYCNARTSQPKSREDERRKVGVKDCVALDRPGTFVVITKQQIGDVKSITAPSAGSLANQTITSDPGQKQYMSILDSLKPPPPPPAPTALRDGTPPHRPR